MKAASFVIGILVGMVLLVVAVGGGLAVALSVVTVGQIEDTVGTDIIDDASDANGQTLLDLAMSLMGDLADPSSITINLFREKYGLKLPEEISGIDISVLFDYPISEVADHLGDVVNNMTLRDVGEFLDMDFETEYPDLRVLLQDNLDEKVNVALDNVLSSIDDEKMTVYTIERDFGLSLGENNLITTLRHTPLSSFAEVMDNLPVGVVIDADSDLFVEKGAVQLYVVADDYIEVPAGELTSPLADETHITETYIAGADGNGLAYREMRYVMNDDGTYEPDNSCYASSFDAEANTETYYRHIVYTAYDSSANYGADAVFAVKTFLNDYVSDGEDGFVLADGGFLTLDNILANADGTYTLNKAVLNGTAKVEDGYINFATVPVFASVTADDGTVSVEPAAEYGRDPEAALDDNTRLDDNFTGYLRVHAGTAEPPAQVIAGETISTIAGATDALTSLKLGEVLDIDEDSAKILQTLKDTPINKMSDAFSGMVLGDALNVEVDTFAPVSEPQNGETYFVFNETLGYPERVVYDVETAEPGVTCYERTHEGEGNAVLKQLAYVKIDNVSEAMNGIIEDTLLSDIIEIVRETAVKADEAGENWLVAYDPYLTAESADGEDIRYAFVYDGSGSYFRTSYLYTPATDALLPEGETMYFVYEEITDASDLVADQTAVQNVFFRSADGKYYDNPALAAYYAAANTDPSTWTNKPYKRVAANAGDLDAVSATVYPNKDSESGLYIEFFAAYVRYDAENPAHWGRDLFFKFTDGYTLSTADTKDETLYYYDFGSGAYISSESASTSDAPVSDALVMMTGRDDGKYYFSEINGVRAADDEAFASGDTVYSKRLAEVVYKLADNGSFVYEDGGYVAYDPDRHADVTERYDRVTGVLVNKAGNDGGEGLLAPLSTDRVSVVREKSSSVLIAMLERELTIGTLDENIKSFTIEELIDIESGSVFDDPTIRKATVDTLSDAITAKLTNSSIGELIRWANVRGVDEKVLFILEDVKISDFFTALEYKDGTITVNMEKLLGVN